MYIFKFFVSLHFIGGVLVPYFLDWGQISYTQIMILQSFFVFSVFLLEVPTGAVSDFLGRKVSLIFAGLAVTGGAIIYSLIPDFKMFLVGEFFWALGYALLSGSDEAMIYDSLIEIKLDTQSKKIFGRYGSFELGALMIGGPIGSFIAAFIGLKFSMMFMAIPFFIATLIAFTLREPEVHGSDEKKGYLETLKKGILYFKNHKILKTMAFDKISIHALSFMMFWMYQPILTEFHVDIIYFGFIFAGITGSQIGIINHFEFLEKLFRSKKRYIIVSAFVSGTSFILLGINPYVSFAVPLFLLISMFGLTRSVLFQNYFNKHIESHNRATVISTISMVERFVMAIIYPLVGLLVEWSLTYSCIIIGALILLCASIARTREEHLLD